LLLFSPNEMGRLDKSSSVWGSTFPETCILKKKIRRRLNSESGQWSKHGYVPANRHGYSRLNHHSHVVRTRTKRSTCVEPTSTSVARCVRMEHQGIGISISMKFFLRCTTKALKS
jgi:hypothetical protein